MTVIIYKYALYYCSQAEDIQPNCYQQLMWFGWVLTHWGQDKIAAISQKTLSNAFSLMKISEFQLKFHWSFFLRVQSITFQHWFWLWLGTNQATSHYLNQWWLDNLCIYASIGLNEFKVKCRDFNLVRVVYQPCMEVPWDFLWDLIFLEISSANLNGIIWGPFYYHGLTLILVWISNYTHYKMWDEITYPFPNFKGGTLKDIGRIKHYKTTIVYNKASDVRLIIGMNCVILFDICSFLDVIYVIQLFFSIITNISYSIISWCN